MKFFSGLPVDLILEQNINGDATNQRIELDKDGKTLISSDCWLSVKYWMNLD